MDTSNGLVIEVMVQVDQPAAAVVVRGVGLTEELVPVALVETAPDVWSGLVSIVRAENIRLGFELIPPEGGGPVVLSEFHSLTELGVDPAFAGVPPAATTVTTLAVDTRFSGESSRWGWLAVAAGAAGLALLALWVTGSRPSGADARDPGEDRVGHQAEDEAAETAT